mmetsp:Transcript_6286/g.9530  ORF Transcript_6286/g.9530 Transcript_6286/m.9530 type:complete len:113 (-) Transcript_6286:855-1193(-)
MNLESEGENENGSDSSTSSSSSLSSSTFTTKKEQQQQQQANNKRYVARTISGLISALAGKSSGLRQFKGAFEYTISKGNTRYLVALIIPKTQEINHNNKHHRQTIIVIIIIS